MSPTIPPASRDARADEAQPAGPVGPFDGVGIFPDMDSITRIPIETAELPPPSYVIQHTGGDHVAFDAWLPDLRIEIPASIAARIGQWRPTASVMPSGGDALPSSIRLPREPVAGDGMLPAAFARADKPGCEAPQCAAMEFGSSVRSDLHVTPTWRRAASAAANLVAIDSPTQEIAKLEATDKALQSRIEKLEVHNAITACPERSPPPAATKSRRGRKRREGGLTCEEQMRLLADADPTVMILKPSGIHAHMVARWGADNAFCIRRIQDALLYKAWQAAVEKLRHGLGMTPSDFAEEGLAILSHKPGREDKRRAGQAQQEQATRRFFAETANADIEAKRRGEAAKAARDQRDRQ